MIGQKGSARGQAGDSQVGFYTASKGVHGTEEHRALAEGIWGVVPRLR